MRRRFAKATFAGCSGGGRPEGESMLHESGQAPGEAYLQGAATSAAAPAQRSHWRHLVILVYGVLLAYLAVAYIVMPFAWKSYAHHRPSFTDVPNITHTDSGIPGDPLNVSLIGTETEVKKIMLAAKWSPADALTFRSCLKIASASVLKRPYDGAPVSNLYLFGRKEDLAFEQPVGDNPRHRHHVRFWQTRSMTTAGRSGSGRPSMTSELA